MARMGIVQNLPLEKVHAMLRGLHLQRLTELRPFNAGFGHPSRRSEYHHCANDIPLRPI